MSNTGCVFRSQQRGAIAVARLSGPGAEVMLESLERSDAAIGIEGAQRNSWTWTTAVERASTTVRDVSTRRLDGGMALACPCHALGRALSLARDDERAAGPVWCRSRVVRRDHTLQPDSALRPSNQAC